MAQVFQYEYENIWSLTTRRWAPGEETTSPAPTVSINIGVASPKILGPKWLLSGE